VAAEAQHGESDSGCVSARGPRSGAPGDAHQVGNRHLGARRHRSRDGLVERERVPLLWRAQRTCATTTNCWRYRTRGASASCYRPQPSTPTDASYSRNAMPEPASSADLVAPVSTTLWGAPTVAVHRISKTSIN